MQSSWLLRRPVGSYGVKSNYVADAVDRGHFGTGWKCVKGSFCDNPSISGSSCRYISVAPNLLVRSINYKY